jgi:hypothetical protein
LEIERRVILTGQFFSSWKRLKTGAFTDQEQQMGGIYSHFAIFKNPKMRNTIGIIGSN